MNEEKRDKHKLTPRQIYFSDAAADVAVVVVVVVGGGAGGLF